MEMTNGEIIRLYKQADNKRNMIRTLSELNACPKEDIRQILRDAGLDVPATGNRYTAAKKGAEEAEADGSERKQAKLTEKGKRLLKNEEPTESSDLSTRPIKSDESEDVGMCQQNVGKKSETRQLKTEQTEKAAAPTACQPAQPVDVWAGEITLSEYDEDTIRFAEEELRRLNELIEAMEQDIKRRGLEVKANKCKAEYFRLWLRNTKGGAEG